MKTKSTARQYAYKRESLHEYNEIDFAKIATVAKIWATIIPQWGTPGKRARGAVKLQACFFTQECPQGLTEEQFAIFRDSPIDCVAFYRYRKKAAQNKFNRVRIWQSTAEGIDKYIQKYQYLLPAEAEPETPAEQSAPENISN